MKTICRHIMFLAVSVMVIASCTTGRWVIQEESAVDRDEYTVLEEEVFLEQTGTVSSQNPILRMELLSKTTYEYPEKVLAQRTVQDYRLRPGFVALGVSGAALAFYAANSNSFMGQQSTTRTFTLNAAGVLLGLSAFLNMKPSGDPRPTDEERFLRTTGFFVEADTVQAADTSSYTADVQISYGDEVISENNNQQIEDGLLEVEVGGVLSTLNIQGRQTDQIGVDISFNDSTYSKSYPVDQVLEPYASISSPITQLRSAPEENDENILAELVNGSQVPIIEEEGEWYRVQYGISENYILKEDADLLWRSSEFAQLNSVFAVAQVPFGNIDVESNIPILAGISEDRLGLVISNEDFGGLVTPRTYAHRDGRLMRTYLNNALGYPGDNIFSLQDVSSADRLNQQLRTLEKSATDSSIIFIYLNGYSSVSHEDVSLQFNYLLSAENGMSEWEEAVDLNELFERISNIPAKKKMVVADLDFEVEDDSLSNLDNGETDPLGELAGIITEDDPNTAVLFGSDISQRGGLYVSRTGEDKKHHIFTYYFAKAIQERNTSMATINQYLQRNVTFMSRKIHDRPQDPQFFGNIELDLIADE